MSERTTPPMTAEERLRLLETLLDLVPDFLYVHDLDLRFQYANRAAAEYFSHDKHGIVGKLHREVDEPEQAAFYEDYLRPIMVRGEPVTTDDLPYQRQDGGTGLLQAHIIPFDHPRTGRRMMVGLSRDVTDERQLAAERASRAALERELEIAQRIQRSLLPAAVPPCAGFAIAARCEPAAFAGGDFYDFIETRDGRLVLVLGDVTGHGVGSALIASACRSYARLLLQEHPLDLAMVELDRALQADLSGGSFVTLAFAALHPGTGEVTYLSAGHGPVLHAREQACDVLESHGPPAGLGLFPDDAEPLSLELAEDSTLLIPSDGLIEVRNASGEQFGPARLANEASQARHVEEAVSCCFEAASRWNDQSVAEDDRTAVAVRLGG